MNALFLILGVLLHTRPAHTEWYIIYYKLIKWWLKNNEAHNLNENADRAAAIGNLW